MLVFSAKLVELQSRIDFIRRELAQRQTDGYTNLRERLGLRLAELDGLEITLAQLGTEFLQYRSSSAAAFDIWKQLFSDLTSLANTLQFLLNQELPAYLARSSSDEYMSGVLQAIHGEVGLAHIKPVVTLHQNQWWAVLSFPSSHPLYFTPASVITDPGELPLIFHEIGHTLHKLYGVSGVGLRILSQTIVRKKDEIRQTADPKERLSRSQALTVWQQKARYELEELSCDIVGTLLGGPAFPLALCIGLLATSTQPFQALARQYPPLDVRMRIGTVVLQRNRLQNSDTQDQDVLTKVQEGWANVQDIYHSTQPIHYTWLYDEQYLRDLAEAISDYIEQNGLILYTPGTVGLRARMIEGSRMRLSMPSSYDAWAQMFLSELRRDYA